MAASETREPRQTRAIEKKNKIIEAGFKLFCEKGYHYTNTNEIAKEAGVSTGIVYHYFKDKKAILLATVGQMVPSFDHEIINKLCVSKDRRELEIFLSETIDRDIDFHKLFKAAHEEFLTMCHSDPDIAEYMKGFQDKGLSRIADTIVSNGSTISNPYEKVDIIYHMIDQYCDAVVFSKREKIDYNIMKELLIKNIMNLLYIN